MYSKKTSSEEQVVPVTEELMQAARDVGQCLLTLLTERDAAPAAN